MRFWFSFDFVLVLCSVFILMGLGRDFNIMLLFIIFVFRVVFNCFDIILFFFVFVVFDFF